MIYRATRNICAIQILLWHAKIANMVRCLGVDVEDAKLVSGGIERKLAIAPDRGWAQCEPDAI